MATAAMIRVRFMAGLLGGGSFFVWVGGFVCFWQEISQGLCQKTSPTLEPGRKQVLGPRKTGGCFICRQGERCGGGPERW